MAEIPVQIALPTGVTEEADIPDNVPVGDLLSELVSLLNLPSEGPDGPVIYRMTLKRTEHQFADNETLADAGVEANDRLLVTTEITAGSYLFAIKN